MQVIQVKVDDLLLWQANPRIPESHNQMSTVATIYNQGSGSSEATSHRQLMNLITSIAENGYQNAIEPILVVKDASSNMYIVQDANRRIAAIKLLQNPSKYKSILSPNDLNRINNLSTKYKENIPQILEVVLFPNTTRQEKQELREVLARKHNGPMDGAGTVPWNAAAKDRFFQRANTFVDHLEQPFELQYGQNLTSYLGGSNSVTSTRRIFNSKPIQQYLNIRDINDISPEEIDKVKDIADRVKQYSQDNDVIYSRFKTDDIKSIVNPENEQRINKTTLDPHQIIKRNEQEFLKQQITKRDHVLGFKWLRPEYINTHDDNFAEVNMLLFGLLRFGKLTGDADQRLLKAYLLAPAVRSIFELSLQALQEEGCVKLKYSVSSKHKENVEKVCSLFCNASHSNPLAFIQYLSDHRIYSDSFKEMKSLIKSTNFADTAYRSNSTAHKSMKNVQMSDLLTFFSSAVLFAILSEQYARYYQSRADDTALPGF